MISASVSDSEPVLKVLLQKGADVNEKSKQISDTNHAVSAILATNILS